jgi:uncharacterized membrane protein YbhN (UPF0104 family)
LATERRSVSLSERLTLGPGARRAARIAGVVLAVVTAIFVVVEVVRQWDDITAVVRAASPWWLVASAGVFVVGEVGYAAAWPLTLRRAGHPVAAGTAGATFLVTQTAKFVPGSVWHAVGRVGTADRLGVPKRVVAGSLALEMAASVAAAVAIGGVMGAIAPLVFDDVAPWLRALEVVGALGAAAAVVVAGRQIGARIAGRGLMSIASFGVVVAWHVIVWVVYGVAAGLLALGLGADLVPTIGAFAISWVAGFLVVGAPAGLGVREAVMTAALTPSAGPDVALAVAVGSRALWTLVQLGGAVVAVPYLAHRGPGTHPPEAAPDGVATPPSVTC